MKLARHYIAAVGVIAAISVPVVLATNVPEPPPPPEAPPPRAIPNCEAKGTLDQTSVGCPTDGSQTLVCNLELKDALGDPTRNFGLDNEDCCTCNVPAGEELTECDPNIDPPALGACPLADLVMECDPDPNIGCPAGVLVEPTSIIEAVRNPNTCIYKTILGKRTLFCEGVETAPARRGPCLYKTVLGKRVLFCKEL
jgi:hypothetical protein